MKSRPPLLQAVGRRPALQLTLALEGLAALLDLGGVGAEAAAIAYTLTETAKLDAVDARTWLADAISRLPDYKITKVNDLLPWHWNG